MKFATLIREMSILISVVVFIINTFLIITILDIILMGALNLKLARKPKLPSFMITAPNRIDFQSGNECAAYSSAYLLRHLGQEADGDTLYTEIGSKLSGGYVYPKGIKLLLAQYGVRVRYCRGNLNALKNEVTKGAPVIIMIRSRVGESYLHFVPVVGYDEEFIYIADSWKAFANCGSEAGGKDAVDGGETGVTGCYNRKVPVREFKKLWNTAMLKMPLYKNTFFSL